MFSKTRAYMKKLKPKVIRQLLEAEMGLVGTLTIFLSALITWKGCQSYHDTGPLWILIPSRNVDTL